MLYFVGHVEIFCYSIVLYNCCMYQGGSFGDRVKDDTVILQLHLFNFSLSRMFSDSLDAHPAENQHLTYLQRVAI